MSEDQKKSKAGKGDSSEDPIAKAERQRKRREKKEREQQLSSLPLANDKNAREMMFVYGIEEIPKTLMNHDIFKVSIHVDIPSTAVKYYNTAPQPAGNGNYPQQPSLSTVRQELVFPEILEGPVRIVCVGCKRWSIRGDSSIGVDIGNFPKNTWMNKAQYMFTMSANHHSTGPECLFQVTPDPPISELFPTLTAADLEKNVGPVYGPGKSDYVSLAVDLDPGTGLPMCPVGFFLKRDLDSEGKDYKLMTYGDYSCIETTRTKYLVVLAKYKSQLNDNKVMFHSANGDRLVFTVSNTQTVFYGSITLDIYYCKP